MYNVPVDCWHCRILVQWLSASKTRNDLRHMSVNVLLRFTYVQHYLPRAVCTNYGVNPFSDLSVQSVDMSANTVGFVELIPVTLSNCCGTIVLYILTCGIFYCLSSVNRHC